MKILYQSVLGLLGNAMLARAQMGGTSPANLLSMVYEMNEAFTLVDEAIDAFVAGEDPQPSCSDPVSNCKKQYHKLA